MIDVAIITLPSTDKRLLDRCLHTVGDECPVFFVDGIVGCIGHGRAESFTVGDNEYVSFVDPDDEIIPGIYGKLEDAIQGHGDPSIIYHNELVVSSMTNSVQHGWSYDRNMMRVIPERYREIMWDWQNQRYFHHRGVFKRSDALRHCKEISTMHACCESWLMQKMSETGKVAYLNEWGYIWNIHGKNSVLEWL